MLDQQRFQMKALLLGSKLSGLWLFTYQALTLGPTPDRLDLIRRALSEVNQLHGEMFPELEHSLYSDDFISMIEGDRFELLDEAPAGIDQQVLQALDRDWDKATNG